MEQNHVCSEQFWVAKWYLVWIWGP